MAARTIYLVRHGQHEPKNSETDELGPGLTPVGVKQAKLTAQRFTSVPVHAIHASKLRRAAETAAIIGEQFPDLPIHKTSKLVERVPALPPEVARAHGCSPEHVAEQTRLAEKAFQKRFTSSHGGDKHEIVVCHGNLIRYFVCRVLQVRPEAWVNMDIYNCGVTEVLVRSNGTMLLVSHGDIGHLPYHMRTTSWLFER